VRTIGYVCVSGSDRELWAVIVLLSSNKKFFVYTAGDKAANNLATEVGKESCEPKPLPAEVNAKRPLLSKSAVLRMLSEFVKAYTCCANIIVQHSFTAGQSPMLDEVSAKAGTTSG